MNRGLTVTLLSMNRGLTVTLLPMNESWLDRDLTVPTLVSACCVDSAVHPSAAAPIPRAGRGGAGAHGFPAENRIRPRHTLGRDSTVDRDSKSHSAVTLLPMNRDLAVTLLPMNRDLAVTLLSIRHAGVRAGRTGASG